jgi:hypothetical protein
MSLTNPPKISIGASCDPAVAIFDFQDCCNLNLFEHACQARSSVLVLGDEKSPASFFP